MITILAIDDDADILAVLQDYVTSMGYNFVSAPDGIAAIQMARRLKPDLIVTDFHMPAGDGVVVIERIRRQLNDSRIPVVFVSGSGIKEAMAGTKSASNTMFLTKPVRFSELEAAIHKLLGRPHPKKETKENEGPGKTVLDLDDNAPGAPESR